MHKIGFVLGTGTRNIANLMMRWVRRKWIFLRQLTEMFISKHLFYYDTISVYYNKVLSSLVAGGRCWSRNSSLRFSLSLFTSFFLCLFRLFLKSAISILLFSRIFFSHLSHHILSIFHLTRVYFERVIPPRPRPLAIPPPPPPNLLFGDGFPTLGLLPRNLPFLLVLMMSSRLISILSSILLAWICLSVKIIWFSEGI